LVEQDPTKQFEIHTVAPFELFGYDLSFTNASFFMVAVTLLSISLLGFSGRALVPGRLQSVSEIMYEFVAKMVRDAAGDEGMRRFFPFVFTLFVFILFGNMLGMLPYLPVPLEGIDWHGFTITSQIIVTVALAMLVMSVVLVVGVIKNGFGFLKLFAPSGVPGYILWFVVIIEIISFASRPLSLSIRLFANMLAGHILLKVFAGFIVSLAAAGAGWAILGVLPFFMTVALTGLEFLVAFLQAYVFAVLTCMYLNDALHPGH
jgi:F-type H+-transporting ATPase subunit a